MVSPRRVVLVICSPWAPSLYCDIFCTLCKLLYLMQKSKSIMVFSGNEIVTSLDLTEKVKKYKEFT